MFKIVLGAVSDKKNTIGRAQIGKNFNCFAVPVLGLGLDSNFFQNIKPDFTNKFAKVFDGNHPNIGRVVPFIG